MKYSRLFVVSFVVLALAVSMVSAVQPFGATVNLETSSHALADLATSNNALAGNVTELTISGFSTTQTWQGYFGNVSGTIQLADAADNVMYNWTLANPSGEVYASTAQDTIAWANIACASAGDVTTLESNFNIGAIFVCALLDETGAVIRRVKCSGL